MCVQVGDTEVCRVVHVRNSVVSGIVSGFHLEYELVHGTQSGEIDAEPSVKDSAVVSKGNFEGGHAHTVKTSVNDKVAVVVFAEGFAVCAAILHSEVSPCGVGDTGAEQDNLAVKFDVAAGVGDVLVKRFGCIPIAYEVVGSGVTLAGHCCKLVVYPSAVSGVVLQVRDLGGAEAGL